MIVSKAQKRGRRHARLRARVIGSAARPRLAVHKSNTRLRAQLIDDETQHTLASVSSNGQAGTTTREQVIAAAGALAQAAKKQNIEQVVFDHGGFGYRGTIKAFAEAAREAGLVF